MKKLFYISLLSLALVPFASHAAGDAKHTKQLEWKFDGVLGDFDKPSIQRGFQVYREVCAACHSLKRIAFRNLQEIGFSEAEVKQIASEYTVIDGPDDLGDLFERPAIGADRIPAPYPNEKAAAASNGGAYPPDLSLITKARADGPNYVYSLLTGYQDAPADVDLPEGKHYNPYFPGGAISMAPPISDDLIEYQDGTKATKEQLSKDLVNFLQWTAEPEMHDRKKMGVKVLIFLTIMTFFFWLAKRRIWQRIGQ